MRATESRGQRGQGLAEYIIILVAIAVVVLVITIVFGGKIKALWTISDAEVETLGASELGLDDFNTGGGSGGSGGSGGGSGGSGGGSGGSGGGGSGGSGGGGSGGSGGGGSGGSGGSGGGGSGGGGYGGGSGGSGGDGWSGGGGGSGSGGRGSAGGSGRGWEPGASTGADPDGITRPSDKPRTGVWQMGEGEDAVTVYSPGPNKEYKGSAKYDREVEARSAAAEREADRRRWERRQRDSGEWVDPSERSGGGSMKLTMLLLVALLVAAGTVGARMMGGRK